MNKRTSRLLVNLLFFMTLAISMVYLNTDKSTGRSVGVVEAVVGVPYEIIANAVGNGVIKVFVYGTSSERHDFAKGIPTRFGKMDFDADSYLKYQKGWSEKKIHDVGNSYGFSPLRD